MVGPVNDTVPEEPVIKGYCMCGHLQEDHGRSAFTVWGCRLCFCGGFIQRDEPMPGPLRPDGRY